jgi:hypothetical protein
VPPYFVRDVTTVVLNTPAFYQVFFDLFLVAQLKGDRSVDLLQAQSRVVRSDCLRQFAVLELMDDECQGHTAPDEVETAVPPSTNFFINTSTLSLSNEHAFGRAVNPTDRIVLQPDVFRGQKTNRKKMATVAAVFTKPSFVRTPQQVVDSLFRTETAISGSQTPAPPKPENKRVPASLIKEKPLVLEYVRQEVLSRDPEGHKTLGALTGFDNNSARMR